MTAMVRGHLAACADCRQFQVNDRRLKSLLALKRHEKPDAFEMQNVVQGFHRRLGEEVLRAQKSPWSRILDLFNWDTAPQWRVASLTALIMVIGFGIFWNVKTPSEPIGLNPLVAADQGRSSIQLVEASSEVSPLNDMVWTSSSGVRPHYVLDRVAYQPASEEGLVLQF